MITETVGDKPAFLLDGPNNGQMDIKPVYFVDNQKSITAFLDPEVNRRHRQAAGPSPESARIIDAILTMMRVCHTKEGPHNLNDVLEGFVQRVRFVEWALAKELRAEDLTRRGDQDWDAMVDTIRRAPYKPSPNSPIENPNGWIVTPEAFDLAAFVQEDLKCPLIVLSGIVNNDENIFNWNKSFIEQGFRNRLTHPYYVWRPPSFDSSGTFKGTVHGICNILGVPTVGMDDDGNPIRWIANMGNSPACWLTRPEHEKDYVNGGDGLDQIQTRGGQIFQLGRDGESLVELAAKSYRYWQERQFQVSPPRYVVDSVLS